MNKYYDQHTHSSFSPDCKEDLRNYCVKAKDEEIEYVCTCEHFDYLTTVDGTTWIADYDKLIEYHKALKKEFPNINLLLGVELGYKKTAYEELIKLSNKYPYDIIQLSLHENDKYDYYFKEVFLENNPDESMIECLKLTKEAIERVDNFDVLSHIDFGFKTLKMIDNNADISNYDEYVKDILRLLISKGKAFEVNTKVQEVISNIDGDDRHLLYLLKTYKELGGIKLTLSSDAHTLDKYRSNFDRYMKIIKDNGFDYLVYYIKRKEYKYYL